VFVVPVVQEDPVSVDLVLQREVEGEVLNAFVGVDLHPGGVVVGLEVLDDVGEPHREPIVPVNRHTHTHTHTHTHIGDSFYSSQLIS